jgi:YwiC-like protein
VAGRPGPGWVPNQHGAWAMLATPLVVGVLASGPSLVQLPLAAFWFTGYLAFFATGLWLKSRRRPRYRPPVLVYGAAAAVLGLAVLLAEPRLVRWVPLFVIPLGVGLYASVRREERSLWSGLSTSTGSSLMTLVAYDAGGGTDWERAWLLTAVLAAYFAGTVFYVKTMIRERGSVAHRRLSVGFHAAATVAMAWVSWPLVVVFALLTLRAWLVPSRSLSPTVVGLGEVAATVIVAATALLTA